MRESKKNLPLQEVIHCGYRTPIKNHLVERAARAYLQPTVVKCKLNKKKFSSFYRKFKRCLSFSSMVSKRLKSSFVEAFGCLLKLLKAPFGFMNVIC
ncbi:hypothetical protein O6H91_01G156000 [Diphasiastrum complanatum]|nr:hypothetical protein O6H91_01G156000 [Diphasiastrum complanatum]